MLYEFRFKTGDHVTPLGYELETTDVHSNIHFIFDWLGNDFSIHDGYKSDLGAGLKDKEEIGCWPKKGFKFNAGKRLKCTLDWGTSPEDMPKVLLSGYEEIPANTEIEVLVTNIESIPKEHLTTI